MDDVAPFHASSCSPPDEQTLIPPALSAVAKGAQSRAPCGNGGEESASAFRYLATRFM